MKTQIEDSTMDGQEVFSQLHLLPEDMMLIHTMQETKFVNNTGERMLNLPNSTTDTMSIGWITDQERHGSSGTGLLANVEDGHSGDILIIDTVEELGFGWTINLTPIAGTFEDYYYT